MAKVNNLISCFICNNDCSKDFITIEKNYTGDITIFLDLCKQCFDSSADDDLKKCVYGPISIHRCVYCWEIIENEMGEIIFGNKNASGNYCAVYYKVWQYVFMHVECYEENIGI